jgi:hypothetical protein
MRRWWDGVIRIGWLVGWHWLALVLVVFACSAGRVEGKKISASSACEHNGGNLKDGTQATRRHSSRCSQCAPVAGGKNALDEVSSLNPLSAEPSGDLGQPLPDHPLLVVAREYLGKPYRFGAAGEAFDCSGLVYSAAAALGLAIPRSARDQFRIGEAVAREKLRPGDLVFFRTYRRGPSHVGIYAGGGKFLHAARRGRRVRVDRLDDPYYASRFLGARRLRLEVQAPESLS